MAHRPELLSLLRAVKEDPPDTSRRLVLADWLEENGDKRDGEKAALLRASTPEYYTGHDPTAKERMPALYPTLAARKFGLEPGDAGLLKLRAPARRLAARKSEALLATEEWAWVESLYIRDTSAQHLGLLREMGLLAGIPSLRIFGPLFPEGAAQLATLPDDGLLRDLDLRCSIIETRGVTALSKAAFLPRLEGLYLSSCFLGPASIRELASAPLHSLRDLNLYDNRLRDGVAHLAGAKWLSRLQRLWLNRTATNLDALRRLLRSDLSGLEELHLSNNPLPPALGECIAEAESLARLRTLCVGWTGLGDAGLAALARSRLFGQLDDLGLSNCQISAAGLRSINESPLPPSLTRLNLGRSEDGDSLARAVARSSWADKLVHLEFNGTRLTSDAVDALVDSPNLGSLVFLWVQETGLDAASVARLQARFGCGVIA